MKKTGFIVLLAMLAGRLWAVDGAWDIMDKAMGPLWNHDEGATTNQKWKAYIGNEVKGTTDTTSYAEGWVNITKLGVGSGAHSALINSEDMQLPTNTAYTIEIEARINRINKEQYPDESGVGFESNLLSARINQKTADFYLRYSDDPGETDKKKEGYAYLAPSLTPDEDELYYLDVSEWHKYRLIMSADNTVFDVYVDGKLVFESVPTKSMSSTSDIVRIGADPAYRCNVDVRHVRVGTGDFNSTSRISTISLSSDSHVVGAERTITVQANTVLMPEGQKLQVSLVDEQGKEVVAPAEYATSNNLATMEFTIPATVAEGKYAVQVSVPGGKVGEVEVEPKTFDYVVTGESPIGYFPKVNPVGFVRDIDDYQFIGAKKEFIFPSIVDAKAHLNADGKFLNGIREYLASVDGNSAMDELKENGNLTFDVNGTAVVLSEEDLLIDMAQTEGYVSDGDNEITVVLDTKLTPELIEEGFVREIISKVQTMRKEADFQVTDKITVSCKGNEKIEKILNDNKEEIQSEVLAAGVTLGNVTGYVKDWNINGEEVTLGVERV